MAKVRRFFFHYRKVDDKMTVHFMNKCYIVDDVKCSVECESKRNNRQPRLVMQGFAECIHLRHIAGKVIGFIS